MSPAIAGLFCCAEYEVSLPMTLAGVASLSVHPDGARTIPPELARHSRSNGKRSGGGDESARLAGEATEDSLASRGFYEMEYGQGEQDQDGVREPGVESDEVKALGHVVGVEKLEDVEVEEIEAVAALADQEEGAPGEEGGDGVGTA
jgi:hypothetical protein